MIVTVTPSPSLDRTLEIDTLRRGALHRASAVHVHPGGKGVNVARALAVHGVAARAVVPAGGAEGRQLLELLAAHDLEVVPVTVSHATRVNVAIVEPRGVVTKINAGGSRLAAGELDALLAAVAEAADAARWIVSCGSIPSGSPADLHARVVAIGRRAGVRVAVDTSGAPLLAAVAAGPDLVKPNRRELEEAVGAHIESRADAVAAARALQRRGARDVLVSLGGDGAVLVAADGSVCEAAAPAVTVRSTVGAGDTLLAGYLAGGEGAAGLELAVEWAKQAIAQPGTSLMATEGAAQENGDGATTASLLKQVPVRRGEAR